MMKILQKNSKVNWFFNYFSFYNFNFMVHGFILLIFVKSTCTCVNKRIMFQINFIFAQLKIYDLMCVFYWDCKRNLETKLKSLNI